MPSRSPLAVAVGDLLTAVLLHNPSHPHLTVRLLLHVLLHRRPAASPMPPPSSTMSSTTPTPSSTMSSTTPMTSATPGTPSRRPPQRLPVGRRRKSPRRAHVHHPCSAFSPAATPSGRPGGPSCRPPSRSAFSHSTADSTDC